MHNALSTQLVFVLKFLASLEKVIGRDIVEVLGPDTDRSR